MEGGLFSQVQVGRRKGRGEKVRPSANAVPQQMRKLATLEAQFVFAVEPFLQGFELLKAERRERLTGSPRQIEKLLEELDPPDQ